MSESDSSWSLQGQDRSELVPLILWSLSFFFLRHTKRIFLNSPRSLIVCVLEPVMIVMMYGCDRAWMARPLMSQVSFVVCSCHRKFLASVTDDKTKLLAQVVQKVGSAIHWVNLFPVDISAIGFLNTYPLDSDLSNGLRYPTFEQLGPGYKGQLRASAGILFLTNTCVSGFEYTPSYRQMTQIKRRLTSCHSRDTSWKTN